MTEYDLTNIGGLIAFQRDTLGKTQRQLLRLEIMIRDRLDDTGKCLTMEELELYQKLRNQADQEADLINKIIINKIISQHYE